MDKNIVRNPKFVKIVGIFITVLALLASLYLVVTKHILASVLSLLFAVLGIVMILAYIREIILVKDDKLIFFHLFRKPQKIKYSEIRCLLLVPLNNKIQLVLIGRQYNRLKALDPTLVNLEIIFEALDQKGIPSLDFGEMVENKQDVSPYLGALNIIERGYYKSLVNETNTVDNLLKGNENFNIKRARKLLKAAGWVFIISDGAAYLIGGEIMILILVAIPLATYALYIRYYPYAYIDISSEKGKKEALRMPSMGACIALFICLLITKDYNCDFGILALMTVCLTVILSVPYIIKSFIAGIPQRLGRKISVIFTVLAISFAITLPVNLLLTFEIPTYTSIVITNKKIHRSKHTKDYTLYGNFNGKEEQFNVSEDLYDITSIGDLRTVCISRSALGLEYYAIYG